MKLESKTVSSLQRGIAVFRFCEYCMYAIVLCCIGILYLYVTYRPR